MRSLLKTCLGVIGVVLLARLLWITSFSIPSEGMENALLRGDRVLVNRWSYGYRLPFPSWIGYHRWFDGEVERGEVVLFNNPSPRPARSQRLEQREVFVSRCIGLPGDTLTLNHELLSVKERVVNPNRKLLYAYPIEAEEAVQQALNQCELSENELLGYDEGCYLRSFSRYELYLLKQALRDQVTFRCVQNDSSDGTYTLVVPSKGKSVRVYPWNVKLLCNTINQHEGRHATVQGDSLWVDARAVTSFTFTKDYYWVASDNSLSLCDSRLFGFVPKDHLIGRVSFIWFSKDPKESWWSGVRWGRCFRKVQ